MFGNTHQGFVIAFVDGPPGSGKSYMMARDVLARLVESDARIITNLPLEVDKCCEYAAKKTGKLIEEFQRRIVLLDKEMLQGWRTPAKVLGEDGKPCLVQRGPWDLPLELTQGADLLLDESHLFCPNDGPGLVQRKKAWTDFLGETRHGGWRRFVFLTQDVSKVGSPIIVHADLRYQLKNAERLRLGKLFIPFGDLFELRASITGNYRSSVAVWEFSKGGRKVQHSWRVGLDPFYFQFYRSFQLAGGGTAEGEAQRPKREFETRPRLLPRRENGRLRAPTWLWFGRRNFFSIFFATTALSLVLWLFAGGGMVSMMRSAIAAGVAMANRAFRSAVVRPGEPEVGSAGGAAVLTDAVPPAEVASASRSTTSLSSELAATSAVMAKLAPEDRAVMEKAMLGAASEIRKRDAQIKQLEQSKPVVPDVSDPLPFVSAFVGKGHAVINGQKLGVGDELFLDGGTKRVKVSRIDRATRSVYLEDSRILRFAVGRDGSGLPVAVPAYNRRAPTPAGPDLSSPVRSLDGSTTGNGGLSGRGPQKSIVVGRSDESGGVRPAPGGRERPSGDSSGEPGRSAD